MDYAEEVEQVQDAAYQRNSTSCWHFICIFGKAVLEDTIYSVSGVTCVWIDMKQPIGKVAVFAAGSAGKVKAASTPIKFCVVLAASEEERSAATVES